jgi:hypothetical protein
MRPLAYLVTALLAASLAYGWWMSNHLTTMEAAVFGIGAAVNMLMYALAALEV